MNQLDEDAVLGLEVVLVRFWSCWFLLVACASGNLKLRVCLVSLLVGRGVSW
jgi:hypothetical protein